VGGVFVIFFVSLVIGLVVMALMRFASPSYFRGETLNRATPTLVPEEFGAPIELGDSAASTAAAVPVGSAGPVGSAVPVGSAGPAPDDSAEDPLSPYPR
jgi:hypothetical protein